MRLSGKPEREREREFVHLFFRRSTTRRDDEFVSFLLPLGDGWEEGGGGGGKKKKRGKRGREKRIWRYGRQFTLETMNEQLNCCGKRVGKSIYYEAKQEFAVHSWRVSEWRREKEGTTIYAQDVVRRDTHTDADVCVSCNGLNKWRDSYVNIF